MMRRSLGGAIGNGLYLVGYGRASSTCGRASSTCGRASSICGRASSTCGRASSICGRASVQIEGPPRALWFGRNRDAWRQGDPMGAIEDFHSSGAGRGACPVRLAAIRSARSSSSGSLRQRPKAAIAGCTSPRSIAVRRFSSWPSSAANRPESCETRSMRWSSAAPIQDRYRAFTTLDGESLACQYAGEQLGEAAFRLGNIYRLQEAFLGQILDCRYAATGRSACAQTVTQVRNNALVIMTRWRTVYCIV